MKFKWFSLFTVQYSIPRTPHYGVEHAYSSEIKTYVGASARETTLNFPSINESGLNVISLLNA